jgi:hypothetical protein
MNFDLTGARKAGSNRPWVGNLRLKLGSHVGLRLARHPHAKENYDVQLQGGTLIVINSGGHTMPKLRLVIPLILAFMFYASIAHLQAQLGPQVAARVCPVPPTGFGAAMSYFVHASATPGGEGHHLANKTCFDQDLDLSDQNTMNSTTPASNATTTYSYHVGRGRLSLQAEANVLGHRVSVPISGGTNNLNGRGSGDVVLWLYWVDQLTLHSKTAKHVSKDFPEIDPSQIAEIRIKLLNNGHNQCSGGGSGSNFYKTSVSLVADTGNKQVIGGHEDLSVDSDCQDQQTQGTIQVLLGLGQFRIELGAYATLNGYAQHGDGYQETGDVKVKLGEYQVCVQATKGPADLKITSASGTDYTCPKK